MKPNRQERDKIARLKGRKIVRAEVDMFDPMRAGEPRARAHDWCLVLDDGTRVRFLTEETETGDYGVDLVLTPAGRAALEAHEKGGAK